MPDAASARPRTALAERIRTRIRSEGPIGFDVFMESALYDPEGGYYAGAPVFGDDGDFVTSPHVSPGFGVLLARCVDDLWRRLGRPDPFVIAELGAGDGALAERLLASVSADLAAVTTFALVERGPGSRARLARIAHRSVDLRAFATLDDAAVTIGRATAGVLVANELLDNLPFRRIRGADGGGIVELAVGLDGERFAIVERRAAPELVALARPLAPRQEGAVAPAALDLVERAVRSLAIGYVLLIDYATGPNDAVQVHGYRGHRIEADVLDAPGTRDITAGVDMEGVARRAASAGATVWGPISQRRALLNLGFAAWDAALRVRQTAALGAGRGADATAFYSARNRARMLLDPDGLGGFEVLCLGVGGAPRPALLLDGGTGSPAATSPDGA